MDEMQSKQHTLREETLTHNTLDCMVCLKKHIRSIKFLSSCIQESSKLWDQCRWKTSFTEPVALSKGSPDPLRVWF